METIKCITNSIDNTLSAINECQKEDACVAKEGTSKKGEQPLLVGCRILLLKWSADHHDHVEKVILLPVSLIFREPYFICTHVTMIINHFKAMLVMMIAYHDPVNLTHLFSLHWTFQIMHMGVYSDYIKKRDDYNSATSTTSPIKS